MIFLLPFSLSDIILVVGVIVGGILIGIGLWSIRKETTVDPRFAYLTVWYSDARDTPDTKNPHRPYFIVNWDTKQAYYVSDLIAPYIKKKMFQFGTYPSKRALLAYFKKEGITPNRKNPEPEELGLLINKDGSLSVLPKIIYKLKNRTFPDLEIKWLFPWYYHFLPSRFRSKLPNKRLLLKISTKEIFTPPYYDFLLFKTRKISKENYIMKSGEHLKEWAERYGYTYRNRPYSEKDLLAEPTFSARSHDK